MVLESGNEEQAVQSQADEAVTDGTGMPNTVCNYFNGENGKQVHLPNGGFKMSVRCKIGTHQKWHSSKQTQYEYEIDVEGPDGNKTRFIPPSQRPVMTSQKVGPEDMQVDIPQITILLGDPDKKHVLQMLWEDLGSALDKCEWSLVGNWKALRNNIDPSLTLKCHRPESYFYHKMAQVSDFAPGHGPFDGQKQKICNVMKAMKSQVIPGDDSWTLSTTCSVAKHEKWYSSSFTTYKYEAQLEGPNNVKANFAPPPQRPVLKNIKQHFAGISYGEYYEFITLGSAAPSNEGLLGLWPELGAAIKQCQFTLVGRHEPFLHPDLHIDPELRMHCVIEDAYWKRTFRF